MSDLPATRRYNEKEVSRLLKRAAELQRAAPSSPSPTGLTLGELEEIAREAGLDVTLLRRAAGELDAGASGSPSSLGTRLAGGPLHVLVERTLPFEVPNESFSDLVPIIQSSALGPGNASQVGRSFSWASQSPGTWNTQVLVTVRKGETLIRIEERFGNMAGGIFGGGLGGIGGGLGIGAGLSIAGGLGGGALFLVIPASIIAGTYVAARTLFGTIVNRRKSAIERLMARILETVQQRAPAD